MIIMPLVAPTDQLKLSSDQLSWSTGARCGNRHLLSLVRFFFFCLLDFLFHFEPFWALSGYFSGLGQGPKTSFDFMYVN